MCSNPVVELYKFTEVYSFSYIVSVNVQLFFHALWSISKHFACNITMCRSVLLVCSSVLGTEVTQPDRSSVTSVLGQFGPQKKTEVTEDRSDQGPKWMYPAKLGRLVLSQYRLIFQCDCSHRSSVQFSSVHVLQTSVRSKRTWLLALISKDVWQLTSNSPYHGIDITRA